MINDSRSLGAVFLSRSQSETEANEIGLLGARQMSILIGIPRDEISAEFRRQRGATPDGQTFAFVMPRSWIRSGKGRTALARTDDMGDAVQILSVIDNPSGRWADRHGAVWTVTGNDAVGVPLMDTSGSATSGPQRGLTVQQAVKLFGPLRELAPRGGGQ